MIVTIVALGSVVISTVFGAYGSLFLKKGSSKDLRIRYILKNHSLIWGIVLYGIATIFGLLALKFIDLSIAYPITSLSYVWVILLSKKYLNEKIKKLKVIGMFFIILGVVFIGLSMH